MLLRLMSPPREAAEDSSGRATECLDLVHRAQSGDQEALNQLCSRYNERVRLVASARMGAEVRRYLESDDIAQEAFVAAILAFDRFEARGEGSFIAWLARITARQVTDAIDDAHREKRDRRREVSIQQLRAAITSGTVSWNPAASITLPPDKLVKREEITHLLACLDRLSEEYREVICQRYFVDPDGSWDDIAEAIGSPNGNAARQLYVRAEARLASIASESRD